MEVMTEEERKAQEVLDRDYAETWDALEDVTGEFATIPRRRDRQLNIRVDEELLDALRRVAGRLGQSYHSLARRYIEESLAREDATLVETVSSAHFSMKEAILVLLSSRGPSGKASEPVEGRTRLQKLLFLVTQHMRPELVARFEAYDYGPFDDGVLGDVHFLVEEGLVDDGSAGSLDSSKSSASRAQDVLGWAARRAEPPPVAIESYRLTRKGMEWVDRFFQSDAFGEPQAKQRLAEAVADLKQRFGRVPLSELVDYVYGEYPEYTSRSAIRHQVAERIRAKRHE